MSEVIAAPWELTGKGYVMFFKFPREFVMERGFLTPEDQERFAGGPGCIIIADYGTSNVGPYQELLFLPGRVKSGRKKLYTISKAYVSTEASVTNGRANWGIPKELAKFTFTRTGDKVENIQVTTMDGKPIIDITVKTSGIVPFPLNSWFKPFKLTQVMNGKESLTRFQGKGWGRSAENMKVDVSYERFPNFAFFKHIAVMRITDFKLKFKAAEVREFRKA